MINLRKANFKDKTLPCIDCEATFTFTRGEQYFFASKGLIEPKRCPKCREERKRTILPQEVRNE